jgi:hypothetical protein
VINMREEGPDEGGKLICLVKIASISSFQAPSFD